MTDFHIFLYTTDSEPNNSVFFSLILNTDSFYFFLRKQHGLFESLRHLNRSRNLVLFSMRLATIESRNLVPFFNVSANN